MNRIIRWSLRFMVVLSALAFWITLTLKARGGRGIGGNDELASYYMKPWHARYTLRTEPTRFAFYRPTLKAKPAQVFPGLDSETLIETLYTVNMSWKLIAADDGMREDLLEYAPITPNYRTWDRLYMTMDPRREQYLLEALEDPNKCVAAHVFLAYTDGGRGHYDVALLTVLHDGPTCVFQCDGLTIRMHDIRKVSDSWFFGWLRTYSSLSDVDSAQFSDLRKQWHRRLDISVSSVSYTQTLLITAVLPSLWAVTFVRGFMHRRKMAREGHCRRCGYDLTGNVSGVCPECGTAIGRAG